MKNISEMIFRKIRKIYYFMYYCSFRVMDSMADRYMKNSIVHGWTMQLFVLSLNLIPIDSLFNLTIYTPKNSNYFWGILLIIVVFNFFVFTYKNRHSAIIEECSQLPYRIRRFGVVFFASYSILSIIAFIVIIFGDLHIQL